MKKGENHDIISGYSRFVSIAYVKGALYDLGVGFPAVVPDDTSEVYGEIYDVDDRLIPDLDCFEGFYPDGSDESLFIRTQVEAKTFKKQVYSVYIYILPQDNLKKFASVERLEGGRWS